MLSKSVEEKVYIYEPKNKEFNRAQLSKLSLEGGLVLTLLVLALALRLNNLTRNSLWLDETTDIITTTELPSLLDAFTYHQFWSQHPPLFFPSLYLWTKTFGLGEFAVRMFSVVMGLATLGVVYFIARRWINQQTAFLSGLLLAVSPLHLFWSQSIRPYAGFTLLVTISMALLLFTCEKPHQNWRWIPYGISLVLLIYNEYLSFHLIFAQLVFLLLIFYRDWRVLVRIGLTFAVAGLAFIPQLGYFLEQAKLGNASYLTSKGPGQLVDTVEVFASWFIPYSLVFAMGAVFFPMYLLGLIWLWQNQRKLAILLACWSMLPMCTAWVSSFLRPNFISRYFVFCVPAFVLVVAVGMWSLRSKWRFAPYTLAALAIALNIASYVNYTDNYHYQDWRGLVNYIAANRQEGDSILLINAWGYTYRPFNYYYIHQLGQPGKLPYYVIPEKLTEEVTSEAFGQHGRVWMIVMYDGQEQIPGKNANAPVPANFAVKYYKEYSSNDQGNVGLTLFARKE